MRAVNVNIGGRELCLAYNGEAMFAIDEHFDSSSKLLDIIGPHTKESIKHVASAVAILAEQGELARRELGYEAQPIVTSKQLAATMTPTEMLDLKTAIPQAINNGLSREVVPAKDEEIDLGLLELQKKTR